MDHIMVRVYSFLSLFTLIGGVSIYFLFRNSDLLLFKWFENIKWLNGFYIPLKTKENPALSVLVYNLPDGLWLLSGIFSIRAVWLNNKKWCEVYILIFSLIAVLFEVFQFFGKMPGTFDIIDLIFLVSIAFVEGIIFRFFIKRSLT